MSDTDKENDGAGAPGGNAANYPCAARSKEITTITIYRDCGCAQG